MSYTDFFHQLNTEQQHAVTTINGPVMVLAGPGTGKTQLLSVRTANILRQTDLFPSNILVLTFTNAAAKAMRERLASMMGPNGYEVVVETFHSLANMIITESEEASVFRGERIELTELERIRLLEYLLDHLPNMKAIRSPNAPYIFRRDIETAIGMLKRDGVSPEDVKASFTEVTSDRLRALTDLYSAYEEAKSPEGAHPIFDSRGRYDFDDMIDLAVGLLLKNSELLARYQEQFQYVMVDEFQDTNGAQLKFLLTLFNDKNSNICAVGDDDQSIYRFQGASTENFRLFQEYFLNIEKIVLSQHYRSLPDLLRLSYAAIRTMPKSSRLAEKKLIAQRSGTGKMETHIFGTSEEELSFLMNELKKIPEKNRKETALLVRTRKDLRIVAEACLQTGIPYATDGKEDIRGETRVHQLIRLLALAEGSLTAEEHDVLLFEILLFDFFKIDHRDLIEFSLHVQQKRAEATKKWKRSGKTSLKTHQKEELLQGLGLAVEKKSSPLSSTLLSELFLRFPLPSRILIKKDEPPTSEETNTLSILRELSFQRPEALNKASWILQRLISNAASFPVYPLVMEFLRDAGMTDFILKTYETNRVLKLRDLRAISAFVENLKKASHADPSISLRQYLADLKSLERHEISLAGSMVASDQEGVRILTAHSAKGLEFENVFIPFCIDKSSWPKRYRKNSIPLPRELLIGQQELKTAEEEKQLHEEDELRLFYVAMTRAKNRLLFTAAPEGKEVVSRFLERLQFIPKEKTKIPEEQVYIHILEKNSAPDPIKNTAHTLAGLVENLSLSPSSLNRYLTCPRQFLYQHLLKTAQPKKTALVYGQCVHKALEKSFRRFLKEGKLPGHEYFEAVFQEELHFQGVEPSVHQSCLQKFDHAKAWYQEQLTEGAVQPLELEKRFIKKLPEGLIFEGKFDKIEAITGTNEVKVIDYKTGEPDKHIRALHKITDFFSPECDDYLRQLIAYKMLYESGYARKKVKIGELQFLDPAKKDIKKYDLQKGKFVRYPIALTTDMVKNFEKLVLQTWRNIKALEFDRLQTYDKIKCGYCPYQNVCWQKNAQPCESKESSEKIVPIFPAPITRKIVSREARPSIAVGRS